MKSYHLIIFLIVSLTFIAGCGEDSEDGDKVVETGDISGTVINKETGEQIVGASVNLDGKTALTDENGKFFLGDVSLSDALKITVTAVDYQEYTATVSLTQELLIVDVSLIPIDSPSAEIVEVLNSLSEDIEALDPTKIPAIQNYFVKDYVAGEDEATAFGIFAGVVPPNFDAIPDTFGNIIKKYKKLDFKFSNPDVKIEEDSASVLMRFIVYAETNPPEPKAWDIMVDGRIDMLKQDGEWKIVFWQLIPPFLKFEEKPL